MGGHNGRSSRRILERWAIILLVVLSWTVSPAISVCRAFTFDSCIEEKREIESLKYQFNLMRIQKTRCAGELNIAREAMEVYKARAESLRLYLFISLAGGLIAFLVGIGLGSMARKDARRQREAEGGR